MRAMDEDFTLHEAVELAYGQFAVMRGKK